MAFALGQQFGTDEALEREGAPFVPIPGVTFWVRSTHAPAVRRAMLALNAKQRPAFAAGAPLTIEYLDSAEIDLCVEVLASWEGVTDETGQPVPFSRDAARALATEVPKLRSAIVAFSAEAAAFRRAGTEAVAKN